MALCPRCKKSSVRRRQSIVTGIGEHEIVVHDFTCLDCGAFENAESGDVTLAPMYARWRAHCTPAPQVADATPFVDAAAGEATRRAVMMTMRELATLLLTLDGTQSAAA